MKLLAFCLMLLPFAAPMVSAAGSGQAQTALMQLAKTGGNVISTSALAPIVSIVYSGSLTLTTTATYAADYNYFKEERTCTVTIPFSNLTLVGASVNGTNILVGSLLKETLSYTAAWSLTPQSHGYQVSINPSSGQASGSLNAAVSGLYEGDHVVFDFGPQEMPEESSFPVTITVTDNSQHPPSVDSFQYSVIHPFNDVVLAFYDAYNHEKIDSATPYVSQHITFNGVAWSTTTTNSQYTGDLTLTVESVQFASLASVTISGQTTIAGDGSTLLTADATTSDGSTPSTIQYSWSASAGTLSNPHDRFTFWFPPQLAAGETTTCTVSVVASTAGYADTQSSQTISVTQPSVLESALKTVGNALFDQKWMVWDGTVLNVPFRASVSSYEISAVVGEGTLEMGLKNLPEYLEIAGYALPTAWAAPTAGVWAIGSTVYDLTWLVKNGLSGDYYKARLGPVTVEINIPTAEPLFYYNPVVMNNIDTTTLVRWNDDGSFQPVAGSHVENGATLVANVDHFSLYSIAVPISTGPSNRTIGVNQGNWAKYNVSMGAYGGTLPPGFVEVQSRNLSITSVSGSSAALGILAQYKNGTSDLMTCQIDVNTGEATNSGPSFFLIAAGLGAGEDENNFKMNGTSTWQYNGHDRPTVYSNSSLGDYIWDQTTGLLIYAKLPQYSEESITLDATMVLQLVDTNAFVAITQHTLTIQPSTGGSTSPTGTHAQGTGTTLNVTATPNNGYTLYHWLLDGANAGNSNPFTATFESDHTLQPVFTQGGSSSNRTVGVDQGDWAQYSVSWQAGAPSSFSDVTGFRVTVVGISSTILTISVTMQFKNGTTTPSGPSTLDVNTGQGNTTTGLNMEVIASGLNPSDLVFTSQQSSLPNAQIADITPWTRDGFNRTAVHLISNTLGEYYWDRDTGILLYAEVPVYSGNSTTPATTATLTLAGTNRFNGGSAPSSMPNFLLPSVAGVAAVVKALIESLTRYTDFDWAEVAGAAAVVIALIAVVVALRRHRRKTHASLPEETVEPKATPVNPPEAVEPRTPTSKKFAFCLECGEKLPDLNVKFCPFCGARLELQPETNTKTNGTEPPKEAAPEDRESTVTKAYKKHEPPKNVAKVAKHGWKFKIIVTLLTIILVTNTIYYCGVFNLTPALQPAQQIMDQIWSAPGLTQVHQALSQIVQGIQNLIPGGSNGSGVIIIKPAQDLTGTWVDLPGEGLVVTPLNGPHRFHYDATMDIVQHGSTFTGTMHISLWNAEALVPYSIWVDDGYWNYSYPGPVQTEEVTNGTISGVNIQFQVGGWTWKGTFTTGLMSGTVQGYSSGVNYSGVFNLRRGGTTPTGVPPAPTGVTATAGDGNVSISWSAVSGATSYNLYHSTTSGVTKTTGTKITSVTSPYTHTGLTNGITYYYLVTAVNSSGESVESAQVSAAPTAGGGMLQLIGLYPQLYNHYGINIFVLGNYAYFCEEHVSWTDTYVRILNVATPSAPSLAGSYFVGGVIRAINVADGYMYLGLDNILHEVQTVNIANPAAPSLTAKDTDVSPLDLAVSGSYLYVVGNRALDPPDYIGYDFTSYSLSNKAVPLIVGRYSHPETASDYYREVAVQGNYAYIAANDNGLVVLDISNPAAPSYVGRYSSSVFKGYLKVSVSGDYACVMNMESDIEILDISNPSSISEVGKYTPGALANDFVLSGQYLYVAEGTNGLKIIDISNPASPGVAGYYKPTGPDPISNAVFVSGQYVYVADGQYGLMIIRFTP